MTFVSITKNYGNLAITTMDHSALSDVGMRRANNQDAYTVTLANSDEQWRTRGHLFVVADGMGAHAAGELASKLAAETVSLLYRKYPSENAPTALCRAFEDANAKIYARGQANPDFSGMGTTCSALVLLPQGAFCGHVGDSRIYRLRKNHLEQLTFDHSLVWEYRAAASQFVGQEKPGECKLPSNVITRSLGPHPEVKVDLEGPFETEFGDTFLLCSDGLSGLVSDEEIGQIMGRFSSEVATQFLVNLANLRGGHDNITVIVTKVGEAPLLPAKEATLDMSGGLALALGGMNLVGVIACSIWEKWGPAAIFFFCMILFSMWGYFILKQSPKDNGGENFDLGDPFGEGPHTRTVCQNGEDFAQVLEKVSKEFIEAAKAEKWDFQWSELDEIYGKAQKTHETGELSVAIEHYVTLINKMVVQLHNQPNEQEQG
ncbi:MAG: protein phosphatase 2C domain-containing protein [Pirellulaceae bacterium]|nr:protein phosphatase 2C domain-containing protein [Pirellulaceae bacterium]